MCPLSVGTSRSTHALETGEAKLWSLLVGVNSYQDVDLPSLHYSASDCQGLAEALSEATQGFPRKEVIVHHDSALRAPTLETVQASLREIVAAAKPEDTILFYFSGHGVLDQSTQEVVLCLADTNKNDLLRTGLRLPSMLQLFSNLGVHRQMLWLDACHSGDMTLRGAKGEVGSVALRADQLEQVLRQRAAQSRGFYALLSCDQKQRSWEFPELKHGLFTYYLMRGLRGEAADPQGIIEADGLYKYVYHQTLQYIDSKNQQLRLMNQQKRSRGESDLHPEYPLQTPKRIVEGVGELVLGLKTDRTAPVVNQRRAIIIDTLPNSDRTVALCELLHLAGDFQLENWSHSGKPWTEVRNAIQNLRSPSQIIPGDREHSSLKQTDTILLYFRVKIEQIEDGEAWLVLKDNVKLSRSWLRQELRRTQTAQQIIILDCPGADSLSDWIEELKLSSEHGQCLIAAASPADQPQQFTQALLDALDTKESFGLPVSRLITKLQQQLEKTGTTVYSCLSGVQGVIEILPKSNSSTRVNAATPAKVNLDHVSSGIQNQPQPNPDSLLLSTTAQASVSADSQQQYSQLEKILVEIVGPIAPTLLRKAAKSTDKPQTWIERLTNHLLPHQVHQLQQRLSQLQASTFQPQTKSSVATSTLAPTIPETELHQCEKALANYIGPIATFLVKKVLKYHPQISKKELVELLAAEISDAHAKVEFCQQLLK